MQLILGILYVYSKSGIKFQYHWTCSAEQREQHSHLKVRGSVFQEKAMSSLRMASTARDKTHRRVCYPNEFSPILCGEAGIL
jgi:hypothetical protein